MVIEKGLSIGLGTQARCSKIIFRKWLIIRVRLGL